MEREARRQPARMGRTPVGLRSRCGWCFRKISHGLHGFNGFQSVESAESVADSLVAFYEGLQAKPGWDHPPAGLTRCGWCFRKISHGLHGFNGFQSVESAESVANSLVAFYEDLQAKSGWEHRALRSGGV